MSVIPRVLTLGDFSVIKEIIFVRKILKSMNSRVLQVIVIINVFSYLPISERSNLGRPNTFTAP